MRRHLHIRCTSHWALLPLLAALSCGGCSSNDGYRFATTKDVVFARHDGAAQTADLYRPQHAGSLPAIVLIHGGSWRTGWRWQMDPIAKQLARAGFVVLNIGYRLAPEHRYPAQIEDAEAAVRWLREQAPTLGVDPARIGAWGYSAGAHLALLLATRDTGTDQRHASARISAVVGGGTPADLLMFGDNMLVANLIGGSIAERRATYIEASPISHVSADDPPTFLYQGNEDWVVDPAQTRKLAEALRTAGVRVTVRETDTGHFGMFLLGGDAEREAIAFLQQQLQAPAPSSR